MYVYAGEGTPDFLPVGSVVGRESEELSESHYTTSLQAGEFLRAPLFINSYFAAGSGTPAEILEPFTAALWSQIPEVQPSRAPDSAFYPVMMYTYPLANTKTYGYDYVSESFIWQDD